MYIQSTFNQVLSFLIEGDRRYSFQTPHLSARPPRWYIISPPFTILGLDETQVQDALDQATAEIRDERLQQKLDSLVESGRLTQEQADEYSEWAQARPEGLSPKFGHQGRGLFGGRGRGGHGSHGRGYFSAPSEAPAPEGTSL